LPVKITDEIQAHESHSNAQSANSSQNAETADASAQQAYVPGASSDVPGAPSAATASAVSQASIAELAQLDQTLQQIGINPQSISLFNRMAMLLYANNPAALKMLVQTLQTGADLAAPSPGLGTDAGNTAPLNGSSAEKLLPARVQLTVAQPEAETTNAEASSTEISPVADQSTSHTKSFYVQLEELHFAFGAVGARQSHSGDPNSHSGELLNVTA
jgi:hypothetical protein